MENKINDSKEASNSTKNNHFCILTKIRAKPVILDKIYSFSKKRPFIIFDLISNNKALKLSLQKTFNNSKKKNNLSSELNININNYIYFRKLKENISKKINKIEKEFFQFNQHLNNVFQKHLNKNKLFFENKDIKIKIISDDETIIEPSVLKNINNIKTKIFDLYWKNYESSKCTSSYEFFGRNYIIEKKDFLYYKDDILRDINKNSFNYKVSVELEKNKAKKAYTKLIENLKVILFMIM